MSSFDDTLAMVYVNIYIIEEVCPMLPYLSPTEAALAAGATVLGDPPHYLMTAEQLAEMIALCKKEIPPPPC